MKREIIYWFYTIRLFLQLVWRKYYPDDKKRITIKESWDTATSIWGAG